MLEDLGLTPAAEQIYAALLKQPWQSLAQLSSYLDISEAETRAGLALLSDLQIAAKPEPDAIVVSPENAASMMLAKQEAHLLELKAILERSQQAASQFIKQYSLDIENTKNERVFGEFSIYRKLSELTADAKHQTETFAPKGAHRPIPLAKGRETTEALLDRGVVSRTIYLDSAVHDPTTKYHLDWLTTHGSHVRLTPSLPTRMLIIDKKCAVLPLDLARALDGILVVHDITTVLALAELFELYWIKATPYGTQLGVSNQGLTQKERAAIELLAQGLTDAMIGTKMGISERKARYLVNSLMFRLGARSRFEFGVLATKEGWL